ncbi:DUF1932 domain-containing protein [Paeniglutamicibacter sp. MACA_103]|uniref:NAD(P)-dependent oxidoreductase n=1 Tax=Paeniglutamicibacter sp. MACA_103 TaxID=3377337 RepID=UPI003895E14B
MKCTIIGLGEAGGIYAASLLGAGHEVSGFDPMVTTAPTGVNLAGSAAEAATGADLVLVLTGAGAARPVARECLPVMAPGSCYADLTSSSPGTMEELGRDAGEVRFADIAILGPVITQGVKTPLMASGPGAELFAGVLRGAGAPVEVVAGPPGAAMAHKLLRSVFMKGIASVVVEAVEAGRAAGMEDWIRAQIAGQLAGDGQAVIDRFLTGTRKHAMRRSGEMISTSGYLAELGVPSEMTDASAAAMGRMAAASKIETVAS